MSDLPHYESALLRRLAPLVASRFPVIEGEGLEAYCDRVLSAGLNASQRAMIAADLYEAQKIEHAARRLDKEAWIATARMTFDPGERAPCCVCGRFGSIAQAHHVVPLATQYRRGFRLPDHTHVWMCPNHHVMIHIMIPDDDRVMTTKAMRARDASVAALNRDLAEDEFEKLLDLMSRSARAAPE